MAVLGEGDVSYERGTPVAGKGQTSGRRHQGRGPDNITNGRIMPSQKFTGKSSAGPHRRKSLGTFGDSGIAFQISV